MGCGKDLNVYISGPTNGGKRLIVDPYELVIKPSYHWFAYVARGGRNRGHFSE